jgi:hypothetical protein
MQTGCIALFGAVALTVLAGCAEMPSGGAQPGAGKPTPAQGYAIHVMAPHKFEDGTVHGPYHHYCKPVSPEVIQCLLFESTDPNALLTDIEYFVAKSVTRAHLPLETWNKSITIMRLRSPLVVCRCWTCPKHRQRKLQRSRPRRMELSSIFGPKVPRRRTGRWDIRSRSVTN